MQISLDLTISANTPKATAAPITATTQLAPGKITGATLQFPSGCQYQAKVQLAISGSGSAVSPILPRSGGGDELDYIALDNAFQFFELNVDIKRTVNLVARGWNEDTVNAHEIKIIVEYAPKEAA